MSHQLTFADSEFSTKRRQTRKEIFLSRMEHILPWQNMTAVIEPFYPGSSQKTESMVTPVFATPILTTSWLA
ncbi:hypothetical protein FHC52_22610 [Enterobacter sp. EC_64]|nr:hypothetical protein [Enterobacter sp. EC_64]